ncbi:MAG: hypothetical protein JNK48_06420 [Bryobacterales bacterium]|nr:hypothetical protein [Bryobacterales bacterium]
MIRLLFLLAAASLLPAQRFSAWERKHNTYTFEFGGPNNFELEWVSASTFRVRRGPKGPPRRAIADTAVEVDATGSDTNVVLRTSELTVEVARDRGLLTVQLPAGMRLFAERAARIADGKSTLDLEVPAREAFYGLGPRAQPSLDARSLILQPKFPFLVTGNGYALWMDTPAPFTFDLGKSVPDRLTIHGDGLARLEYYFAFGPSMKEIWDQRQKVTGSIQTPPASMLELIRGPQLPAGAAKVTTGDLCADAAALMHATMSAVLLPAFDLADYRKASPETLRRAARLGVFSPILQDSGREFTDAATFTLRKRLNLYLLTYADEARYRGYPVIHSLRHQFPRDAEAGGRIDQYMLGDEFLLAPVCSGTARKSLYLPMGTWTDWNTGIAHAGRRQTEIDVPSDGLIILVKSGSIVPLSGVETAHPTELHYFPKNGGEFFIYEPEAADYTQAHAGPAVDTYRVQIESKADRDYEWVLHHMDRPTRVHQVDGPDYKPATGPGPVPPHHWRYDAQRRTVHIGVAAKAGSDIVVNLRFD